MAEDQQNNTLMPTKWIADNFTFLESASITLCVVSYLLHYFEVEGWALAIGISILLYATLVYLSAFIRFSYSQLITSIAIRVCGIAGSVSLVGLLFSLLYFPGARSMLQIGGSTLMISVLALLIILISGKDRIDVKVIIRSLIIALLAFAHLFLMSGMT